MKDFVRCSAVCRYVAAFCVMCWPLAGASGQTLNQPDSPTSDMDTGGLTIEAVAGWDDTVDTAVPVSLSFNISNYSGKDIDGVIHIFDPFSEQTTTLGQVFVGQGGTSRFSFIQDLSTWHDCYTFLVANGRVLWRRQLPIATGSDFSTNFSFVLFLDVQGRTLPLKNPGKNRTYYNDEGLHLAPAHGRPVRCLSAKPWQIPRHPGPMSPVQAVIIQDEETAKELNYIQWRSLAEWMCQGGTVFAPASSTEIPEQILKASPLPNDPTIQLDGLAANRVGLGSLRRYSDDLLSEDSTELRDRLTNTIARLDRNQLVAGIAGTDPWYSDGTNAARNRLRFLGFFAIYMLLSGIVPLVFFRMERRRMAVLTAVIVGTATVMAGLLGAYLRNSEGDLNLITVTEFGAGGAVEVGRISVQSAGGRDTEVTVAGNRTDLQNVTTPHASDYYYYVEPFSQKGYAPFTWQSGLVPDEPDIFRINVPTTPWGRRHLLATAYQPDWKGLEITFDYSSDDAGDDDALVAAEEATESVAPDEIGFDVGFGRVLDAVGQTLVRPGGKFSVRLVNQLPVRITDCQLVIGIARRRKLQLSELDSYQRQQIIYGEGVDATAETISHNVMEFQFQSLQKSLAPGEEFSQTFPIQLRRFNEVWELTEAWNHEEGTARTLTHVDQNGVWIVGTMSAPATLRVDEDRTDFLPDDSTHYFIQKVRPEDMPDLSALLTSDAETSEGSDSE